MCCTKWVLHVRLESLPCDLFFPSGNEAVHSNEAESQEGWSQNKGGKKFSGSQPMIGRHFCFLLDITSAFQHLHHRNIIPKYGQ
jgi:hypothetical protein